MPSTVMLPGFPTSHPKVSSTALKFINDAVYATFYSEKLSAEYRKAAASLLPDAVSGFQVKYLSLGVSPQDMETNFRQNINELLAGPYAGSEISNAVLSLELVENTRNGKLLHWKIVLTGRDGVLITGKLTGSVLYSIG